MSRTKPRPKEQGSTGGRKGGGREAVARLLVDSRCRLGEGPLWDDKSDQLLWLDIDAGQLHLYSEGRHRTRELSRPITSIAPRIGGGFVGTNAEGFDLVDPATGAIEILAQVEHPQPRMRMNDGACDPAGRFWAGSMTTDGTQGAASLYCLDHDGSVRKVLEGLTISNGLGWSPDDETMYLVDTGRGAVDAFDFDRRTSEIENRRTLLRFWPRSGRPDGLTVDAEGFLWIALWGGGAVERYAPDGSLARRIGLPVSQVSSCCFGGRGLEQLFITTAARGLDVAARLSQPEAGGVYAVRSEVAGLPATAFGEPIVH